MCCSNPHDCIFYKLNSKSNLFIGKDEPLCCRRGSLFSFSKFVIHFIMENLNHLIISFINETRNRIDSLEKISLCVVEDVQFPVFLKKMFIEECFHRLFEIDLLPEEVRSLADIMIRF